MKKKNLVLVIEANVPYIRHTKPEDAKKNAPLVNLLFEKISNVYIPLLQMCQKLTDDSIPVLFQMVLPPVLCSLLEDVEVQEQYVQWLTKKGELSEKEILRVKDDEKLLKIAQNQNDRIQKTLTLFTESYHSRLVPQFAALQKKGIVEFLGTCATDCFLPHYINNPEIISAQIETGLHSFKEYFPELPDGFWLPQMGYAPGFETVIRSYGYNYTILDTRSFLFSESFVENGTFYPVKTQSPVVAFGKDKSSVHDFSIEKGYPSNEVYRNENRDIGFELSHGELEPFIESDQSRFATGFKYFANDNSTYNVEAAKNQVQIDAEDFVEKHGDILSKASECADCNYVTQLIHITDDLLFSWHEGIEFLECVFRKANGRDFSFTTCTKLLNVSENLQEIKPYQSSSLGTGYGEVLLTGKNAWMMRYLQKACERIIDLSDRFPTDTGLKARLLNLGVKELMIAQSTTWPIMIQEGVYTEYAESVFKKCIEAFTAVFDSLGSNVVSTEWLTQIEAEHPLFPWMNYRIYSKKK